MGLGTGQHRQILDQDHESDSSLCHDCMEQQWKIIKLIKLVYHKWSFCGYNEEGTDWNGIGELRQGAVYFTFVITTMLGTFIFHSIYAHF